MTSLSRNGTYEVVHISYLGGHGAGIDVVSAIAS
jgi:hypothetical protein